MPMEHIPAQPIPIRRSRVTRGVQTNTLTGEQVEYEGIVEEEVAPKRKRRKLVYAMIEPEAMTRLELTQFESKVFWHIANHVNRDDRNRSFVRTSEIAAALGCAPQNVSRTLRDLRKRRIIFDLGPSAWRINAWITYRGSADDWAKEYDPYPNWSRD